MHYNISNELSEIAKQKMPANIKLLPVMNAVMKIFKCKSDNKVIVSKYITQGFDGAQLSTCVITPRNCSDTLRCIKSLWRHI